MQNVAATGRRYDHHDRLAFVDQCDRPVLELARSESLGEGVGDFLELERTFQCHRIADMTTEEQEGAGVDHPLGRLFDVARLIVQHPLDLLRHILELLEDVPDLVAVHRALHLRQI